MARRYKRSYKSKKRSKRAPKKVSKPVKRYVRAAIAREIPNKKCQRALEEAAFGNVLDTGFVYTMLPVIQQGVTDGDREGNRIKLRKAILRMNVNLYTGTPEAAWIDIYIFKLKSSVALPTTANLQRFLQSGATAVSYLGGPIDGMLPVNKDLFTCYHHKRRAAAPQVTGSSGTNIGSIASSFCWQKNVLPYLAKSWTYDDSGTYPTNTQLLIAVVGSDFSGEVVRAFGEFSMVVDYEYED